MATKKDTESKGASGKEASSKVATSKEAASKETSGKITKHKATTTRKPAATRGGSPQAFDIIPRSQVRPSSNSRPVITSSKPTVADNTLTTPTTAPQLHLSKHKMIDVVPASAGAQGVSVGDLIAKRSQKAKETSPETGEYFLPAEEHKSAPEVAAEPVAEKVVEPIAASPEVIEDKPEQTKVDVEAEAETEAGDAETTEVKDEVKAETDENAAEVAEVPDAPADEKKDAAPDVEAQADEALAEALKEDEPAKPIPHSQAFKDALQDIDDKDIEVDEHGRQHPGLYGGRPVIVVHKHHGAHSAMVWLLWFIVCVLLALLVVNLLLDADVISTNYNVPHTNLL